MYIIEDTSYNVFDNVIGQFAKQTKTTKIYSWTINIVQPKSKVHNLLSQQCQAQ